MSKSVVPAAAEAKAKALESNQKTAPKAEGQQPVQENQDVIDTELEEGIVVESEAVEDSSEAVSESEMASDSSFEEALVAAADSAASLISEAEAADEEGFALSNDDGDSSGIILLVGALGLVGLGVAALAGGSDGPNNAPPTYGAASQAVTVAEDGTVSITATASDPDGDTLTYANTDPANGTLTANGDGTFSYAPDANFNGTDSFTVTATDPSGESATQTVNITVTAVNDAPVAADDTATTDEDVPVTITVLSNDTDIDGDTLTVTATNGALGTTSVNANGAVVYTPNANVSGSDTFTYTVNDGAGGTDTATVSVTITAVNDAPALGPNATTELTIAEDTSGQIIIDVVDVDSPEASLAFNVVSGPSNGTFAGANIYTPNQDFFGSDEIVISLTDGSDTFTYTVDITVTPVNDAPVITGVSPDPVVVDEDSSVAVAVTATDVDNTQAELSYEVSDPANGEVVTGSNGNFTYMPDADFNGSDSFTVTVRDSDGATAQQVINVTVNPTPELVSIDVVGPNATTPVQLDAGSDEFIFQETSEVSTNVVIRNFGLNDLIDLGGASSVTDYSFGDPNGDDLAITFNTGSSTNIILLEDVLLNSDLFIQNYADAVAAVAESLGDSNFVFMA